MNTKELDEVERDAKQIALGYYLYEQRDSDGFADAYNRAKIKAEQHWSAFVDYAYRELRKR